MMNSAEELAYVRRAIQLALEAEVAGDLPVGAVVTLDGTVIAEGRNQVIKPEYIPGNHAEIMALRAVPAPLWPRARQMTMFTSLEPCMMCMCALLVQGVGRVVYAAADPDGGAAYLMQNLPPYYRGRRDVLTCDGPRLPEEGGPLFERVLEGFTKLPCG